MFNPERLVISNITQANPAVVTTSTNHNLTTGQAVRVNVPISYGMFQLSRSVYQITVLSANTFSLQYSQVPPAMNVNSTTYPAFTIPSTPQRFTAEILPVGSGPTPSNKTIAQIINGTCVTTLDDATTNISTVPIPF